jgi:hypothetical protein
MQAERLPKLALNYLEVGKTKYRLPQKQLERPVIGRGLTNTGLNLVSTSSRRLYMKMTDFCDMTS